MGVVIQISDGKVRVLDANTPAGPIRVLEIKDPKSGITVQAPFPHESADKLGAAMQGRRPGERKLVIPERNVPDEILQDPRRKQR